MKPSDLPKDGNFSGRASKKVLKELKSLGISAQVIFDAYIDAVLSAEINLEPKHLVRPKKSPGRKPGPQTPKK